MTWCLPSHDYQSALIISNVLPLPYYMVLMDFLTLSRITNNEYELNWQNHCKLNQSTSTTNTRWTFSHMQSITKESQRSDFFYRTCKIVNRMDKHVNFMETRGLKGRLLKCLWNFYNHHFDINNTCTWYPNCGCVSWDHSHIQIHINININKYFCPTNSLANERNAVLSLCMLSLVPNLRLKKS